ncbi:MAG: LytS/YehU family sensor histidine kinase [Arenicella sp.]|jgi:LytS/YehU family sensor histidine kinase
MLYRCNDKFVSIEQEIGLIENYLVLEKVRYDERVKISFEKELNQSVKIAPLLLLTFVENAFKHGVSQELNEAFISIKIIAEEDSILFTIQNSKAKNPVEKGGKQAIGLEDVRKQLELLYAENYSLQIEDGKETYEVSLKLKSK